jgi:hypothetical protein
MNQVLGPILVLARGSFLGVIVIVVLKLVFSFGLFCQNPKPTIRVIKNQPKY